MSHAAAAHYFVPWVLRPQPAPPRLRGSTGCPMAELDCSKEIAKVERSLSKAWEFLSGEERAFQYIAGLTDALQVAEFSFFMPLKLPNETRRGGVGVLIQHGDAVSVAANMFGVARQETLEADLQDACAEVCNVFSDCIATHFSPGQEVEIGLPRAASLKDYEIFAENCVTRAVYQGCAGAHRLLIVLYDSLRSPL